MRCLLCAGPHSCTLLLSLHSVNRDTRQHVRLPVTHLFLLDGEREAFQCRISGLEDTGVEAVCLCESRISNVRPDCATHRNPIVGNKSSATTRKRRHEREVVEDWAMAVRIGGILPVQDLEQKLGGLAV